MQTKLCSSFVLRTRTVQVLFVSHNFTTDTADKNDHLINASGKMDVKMSSVVKQLMYVLLFRVTTGSFNSFQIRSIEMLRIMNPKYLGFDMIQGIHLCCGSFGSVIHFGF